MEEWLQDSNEALELRLGQSSLSKARRGKLAKHIVRAPEDADVLEDEEIVVQEPFSPAFTYPIFGEHEKIFGYQGLDVKVCPSYISRRAQLLTISCISLQEV